MSYTKGHLCLATIGLALAACTHSPQPMGYDEYQAQVEIVDERTHITEKGKGLLRGLCFNGFDQQDAVYSMPKAQLLVFCRNNTITIMDR